MQLNELCCWGSKMLARIRCDFSDVADRFIGYIPRKVRETASVYDVAYAGGQWLEAYLKAGGTVSNITGREDNACYSSYAKDGILYGAKLIDASIDDALNRQTQKYGLVLGFPNLGGSTASGNKDWKKAFRLQLLSAASGAWGISILPLSWRTQKTTYRLVTSIQIYKIESTVIAGKHVDVLVWQNFPYSKPTNVDGILIPLNERPLLPEAISDSTLSIVEKFFNRTIDRMKVQNTQTHHRIRNYVSYKKKKGTYTFPLRDASKLWWARKEHPWQNIWKILLPRFGYANPTFDRGVLGTTGDCNAILLENVEKRKNLGAKIMRLLEHPIYKYCLAMHGIKMKGGPQIGNGLNDYKVLCELLPMANIRSNFSYESLYQYFGYTQKEQAEIESMCV